MSRTAKFISKLLSGQSDATLAFSDLRSLLLSLGFEERIRGDHHIFSHDLIVEIINLQPKKGKAKPYQVKQVRNILVNYGILGDEYEE